jgi:CMP-N-acetylneuraminic acid synthetase
MCNTGQYSDTWYIDSNIITAKDWRQAIFLEWESFFKYIELNIPPLIDPTTALLTTRFIEEAYKTFNMSL